MSSSEKLFSSRIITSFSLFLSNYFHLFHWLIQNFELSALSTHSNNSNNLPINALLWRSSRFTLSSYQIPYLPVFSYLDVSLLSKTAAKYCNSPSDSSKQTQQFFVVSTCKNLVITKLWCTPALTLPLELVKLPPETNTYHYYQTFISIAVLKEHHIKRKLSLLFVRWTGNDARGFCRNGKSKKHVVILCVRLLGVLYGFVR